MAVPLLDLTRQYAQVRDAVLREIDAVVAAQQFILGPKVDAFEAAMAGRIGCGHAVGMSSGTDAQLAILMALGVGPGDAVITTPYTFFATAGCIHRVGAETVFVDIEPDGCNLSPARLEECLRDRCRRDADGALRTPRGNRVRLICPVHLFGLCCEMDAIGGLAAEFDLPIVEDAAQAIGAEYPSRDGVKQAGAMGHSAYFSFFPAKNLGAFGDAGLATCRDAAFADELRLLRNHGMEQRYHHRKVGGNFRIDALQAAILHAKLPYLAGWSGARRDNAAKYAAAFEAAGLLEFLTPPATPFAGRAAEHHIFHQYVVRAARRDALAQHLAARGIGHGIYYPIPLHLQECFAYLGYRPGDFPESERAATETIALPIFPELTASEQAEVVETISAFYAG
ncbi:MAG: DegT/DnrJ/EryC1/StrS family aminotransferase [Terrimicrobiaceae bacterium]|nr:DegT/DnrJ/EryC1/StrS family aminotransferase [Terrimicrobiaceae bacterium]